MRNDIIKVQYMGSGVIQVKNKCSDIFARILSTTIDSKYVATIQFMHQSIPSTNIPLPGKPRGFSPTFSPGPGIFTI